VIAAVDVDETIVDLLSRACAFFALGELSRIDPITEGLANRNFIVSTPKGQFVLKEALIHTPQEIEQEISYLEHLAAHHFPVPQYLKGPAGSHILCIDEKLLLAQEKLSGEHPRAIPQVCRTLGAALARLHCIPQAGLPKTKNWMNREFIPELLDLLQSAPLQYREHAFASYEKFRQLDLTGLPQSIVHNDVYPGNLLFDGPVLKVVLDWEEVGIDAAVLDVGHAVYSFCLREGRIIARNFRALIAGYVEVRPLHQAEQEILCRLVQYVALTNCIWMLAQFGVLTPDEEKLGWASAYWRYNLDDLELPKWSSHV